MPHWPFAAPSPTLFAPLQGVGLQVLRDAVAARGAPALIYTPFFRVGRSPFSPRALRRMIHRSGEVPLAVQLLGNDPDKLAAAAAELHRLDIPAVDLNLGCPSKRVVSKGAGAALLGDPEQVGVLLAAMRAAFGGQLSAKIRSGLDDASAARGVAEAAASAGIDFLIVHARTRADGYSGVADWKLIRRLAAALPIPVVGNGDCWYAADVARMQAETGCAGVMIGRPALRNPWIFAQAAALAAGTPPPDPTGADLCAWYEDLRKGYRDTFVGRSKAALTQADQLVAGRLKELVRYTARALPGDHPFANTALRSQGSDELLRVAEQLLGPLPASALDLDAHGRHGLERSGHVD